MKKNKFKPLKKEKEWLCFKINQNQRLSLNILFFLNCYRRASLEAVIPCTETVNISVWQRLAISQCDRDEHSDAERDHDIRLVKLRLFSLLYTTTL